MRYVLAFVISLVALPLLVEAASKSQDDVKVEQVPPEPLRPSSNPFQVVVVHFAPKDREFQPGFQTAITAELAFVKKIFDDSMADIYPPTAKEKGIAFLMDRTTPELVYVLHVKGKRPCEYYTNWESRFKQLIAAHKIERTDISRHQLRRIKPEVETAYKIEQRKGLVPSRSNTVLLVMPETYLDDQGNRPDALRIELGDQFSSDPAGYVSAYMASPEQFGGSIERHMMAIRAGERFEGKGAAIASLGVSQIAHELGHAFGCDHDPTPAQTEVGSHYPHTIMEGTAPRCGQNFYDGIEGNPPPAVFSPASRAKLAVSPFIRYSSNKVTPMPPRVASK